MQNVQNAAEIQQRVINLVEFYRTKVGKESQIAKDLAAEYNAQYEREIDIAYQASQEGIVGYCLNIDIPKDAVDGIRVNEQLLGYFYKKVAGDNADESVLTHFLANKYDSSVFTDEEELFLMSHFAEMVNYIIQTPNNDLSAVEGDDRNDLYLLPTEVLNLIRERVVIPSGSMIYNPFAGFAQLAYLYKDSSFICEESYMSYFKRRNSYCDRLLETEHIIKDKVDEDNLYAWMMVALYANGIDATVIKDNSLSREYDAFISYIPFIPRDVPTDGYIESSYEPSDADIVNKIQSGYQNLVDGGKMILIIPSRFLWERRAILFEGKTSFVLELEAFWEQLIADNSLTEIIQLPRVLGKSFFDDDHCIIFAEKRCKNENATFIDARFASLKSENKLFNQTLDLGSLHTMIKNGGKELNTGLRKLVQKHRTQCKSDLLVPQVYVIERPSEAEQPVPLSSLCSLVSAKVRDVQFDLPEDTPWITMSDLTPLYTGDVDFTGIRKADCPNNPAYVEGSDDYEFSSSGKFIDDFWAQMGTKKGSHVLKYRQCSFLDGNSDIVLYERSAKHGVHVAVVRATGKPYAVSSGVLVFSPKDNFDTKSLAALLRLPIVYRQLLAYEEYGLGNHLDDILVPTDKRIIGDELYRMKREETVTNELGDKVQAMKTEYINEVRMRKHDMRPHLRQLASSQRLMLHYVDNASDFEELKRNLRNQLEHSHVALSSLSSIVDHLSDEDKFGTPEILNIDGLLTDIEVNHDESEGFTIEYDCDKESFRKHGYVIPELAEQLQLAKEQRLDIVKFIQDKSREELPLFISIAPVDFQRMVENIIENARKHGFTDHTRTDYYIGIDLSINTERNMYQIDFSNNGTPLPEGMTKARYGLKGEKAGLTGGTGSGGYIVKSIISHYGGDYDVFCKDGITTIRIYLPIAAI